jgi:hypothetical protein
VPASFSFSYIMMLLISNGKAEMFVLQQLICLAVLLCHLAQGRMARLKVLNPVPRW